MKEAIAMTQAIVAPVSEAEASANVRAIFQEIKRAYAVDEVPLIFRLIARLPMYLETSWRRLRFAFFDEGRLGTRTKWMIGLAVSASNNNKPMILECTRMLRRHGVTDAELAELMAVVDVTNGLNKTLKAASALTGDRN
jgi:alkylhydroperoxidase/carboxymuconolactone decarboxylase family protein YurZ